MKNQQVRHAKSVLITKLFRPKPIPVVKPVEFPAIEGLNFERFQQISVEERVKMIPASLFEEILLPNEILSISHEHPLVKI